MELQVLQPLFTVCKPDAIEAIHWADPFLFLGKTDNELSLVCPEETAPPCSQREDGWRAMRIAGTLDFSLVGILAPIATVLANAKVGIFAVSTFDTDYILVKETQLPAARQALAAAGYKLTG